MSDITSPSDIFDFLAKAKNLLSVGKFTFINRRKNLQALAQNGLTLADAKDEILDLVVNDYYDGPKQDYDTNQPGDIWIFRKIIDDKIFYIKLKINMENSDDILKCISFHVDEFS